MFDKTCPESFELHIEGLALFCAPKEELFKRPNGVYEPAYAPVFYNPAMIENRDITMAVLKNELNHHKGVFVFVDPMAATGVRGVRFALEVLAGVDKEGEIFMGDISDDAVKLIMHNIKVSNIDSLSNVNVHVNLMDANELLYHLRRQKLIIDYIDIDPFGSPAPFLHSALSTIRDGGVVGITATDTAVLEGKYPATLYRRYGVKGVKSIISKDIAIRALLAYTMKTASIFDNFIYPILSYYTKHYIRIFVKVRKSATKANEYLKKCLGTMMVCNRCGFNFFASEETAARDVRCPICGGTMVSIKPLWICNLFDSEYVGKTYELAKEMPWLSRSSLNILNKLTDATPLGSTIRVTYIARVLNVKPPPIKRVIECIRNKGFKASENLLYPDALLTNATANDIITCIKNLK
ncbi:MAG: hypothetical protein JHC33_06040 [Ignisphaera sp.]|nr:hypothetical protein [Ignisphaera sp.]